MRRCLYLAGMLLFSAAAAADDSIRIELNTLENAEGRCRASFVIENKSGGPIETLRLDLVAFSRSGLIQRRLVADMGPLRRAKTVVKTFTLEGECDAIGSVLINDVTACAPADAGTCLDRLEPASRVPTVRFYK